MALLSLLSPLDWKKRQRKEQAEREGGQVRLPLSPPSLFRLRLLFTHIFSSTMPLACDAPANGFFHSEPRWDFL